MVRSSSEQLYRVVGNFSNLPQPLIFAWFPHPLIIAFVFLVEWQLQSQSKLLGHFAVFCPPIVGAQDLGS